jgi:hypothetical protein
MDHDETSMSGPRPSKPAPAAGPSDAELSRIAREAVHQPADPRLDRHLARLGAAEVSEAVAVQPGQSTSRSGVSAAELDRLNARVRRIEMVLGLLVVAVGILAVIAVILLLR